MIIDQARTRVLAMLNIVGAGMAGDAEQNLQDMDPGKAAEMAAKHKDLDCRLQDCALCGSGVDSGGERGQSRGNRRLADHGGLWAIQAGAAL